MRLRLAGLLTVLLSHLLRAAQAQILIAFGQQPSLDDFKKVWPPMSARRNMPSTKCSKSPT